MARQRGKSVGGNSVVSGTATWPDDGTGGGDGAAIAAGAAAGAAAAGAAAAAAAGVIGAGLTDPAGATDAEPKRRGGARPGAGRPRRQAGQAKQTKAQVLVNVSFIEHAIYSAHLILAAKVAPTLELEQKEAQALAEAVANVAKHYPLVSRGMTPEQQAWLSLLTTAGMIYGQRLVPVIIERVTGSGEEERGTLQ